MNDMPSISFRLLASDEFDLIGPLWEELNAQHASYPTPFAPEIAARSLGARLRALRDKGRHFTEEEKNWLLDKHLQILRAVIPLHKLLSDSGQVELTTTPFYHPILPLLLDKKLAREAMPDVRLPRVPVNYQVWRYSGTKPMPS